MEIVCCFCCFLSDGFFQIICIASFNFNLNPEEAQSIVSKQFSVLSALEVSLLASCAKMQKSLSFSKCSLILVDKWQFCHTSVTGTSTLQTNLETTKDFRDFGIGSFTLNIEATLNGVKTILMLNLLQYNLQNLLILHLTSVEIWPISGYLQNLATLFVALTVSIFSFILFARDNLTCLSKKLGG